MNAEKLLSDVEHPASTQKALALVNCCQRTLNASKKDQEWPNQQLVYSGATRTNWFRILKVQQNNSGGTTAFRTCSQFKNTLQEIDLHKSNIKRRLHGSTQGSL